jgi:hypothetical protein
MNYFVIIRTIYLAFYYLILSGRPSKSYTVSLVIAYVSGTFSVIYIIFQLIFGNEGSKPRFPFESILFHGLSYEEWSKYSEYHSRIMNSAVQTLNFFEEKRSTTQFKLYKIKFSVILIFAVCKIQPRETRKCGKNLILKKFLLK